MPLYPQGGGLYPNSIDNVLLADMAQATVKGRAAGAGTGDPTDLTAQQLSLLLGGPNFRNILGRNGGCEVWQRGAGGAAAFNPIPAATQQYTADGWHIYSSANQIASVWQIAGIAPGTATPSRWAAYVRREAGQTGTTGMIFQYALDTDEIAAARGSIVTLSFIAKSATGWSPAGGTLTAVLYVGTGAAARRGVTAFTGETIPIVLNAALTPTATVFTGTSSAVIPTTTTQASVQFQWTPVGTAAAEDAFWLDDVQLEVGSIATPFERRPFESELLACQRHFRKSFDYATAPVANSGVASGWSSFLQPAGASGNLNGMMTQLMPQLRAAPTVTLFNPNAANAQARNATISVDCSATVVWVPSPNGFSINFTTAAGSAVGQANTIHWTADAGI